MWKEADEFAHRALAINPHETTAMAITLNVALNGKGDVKEARHLLGTVAEGNLMITDIAHSAVGGLIGYRAFTSMVEHDVDGALKIFSDDNTALDERLRRSARVLIFLAGGDKTGARAEAEKALSVVEARVHERPEDLDAIVQASWVYLGLDRTSEAIAMATRAANLLPPEKDALVGPITLLNLAEIECRSGQATETIEILRRLLSIPAGSKVSIPSLRINPMWDPIRNDPAFQQLLAGSERVGP
jgi:serine/threonine-protein kinase